MVTNAVASGRRRLLIAGLASVWPMLIMAAEPPPAFPLPPASQAEAVGPTQIVMPIAPRYDLALAEKPGEAHFVLAGGRFWGMQAVFQHVKGVLDVTAGYIAGADDTAKYELVLRGNTGHAESVLVSYDPSKISLGSLLEVYFFIAHDPTQLNRQGPDKGLPFRSTIFYDDMDQKRIALAYMDQIDDAKLFDRPIVTKLLPMVPFFPAEGYQQNYVQNHMTERYVLVNDVPRIARLKELLPKLYRDPPLRFNPRKDLEKLKPEESIPMPKGKAKVKKGHEAPGAQAAAPTDPSSLS